MLNSSRSAGFTFLEMLVSTIIITILTTIGTISFIKYKDELFIGTITETLDSEILIIKSDLNTGRISKADLYFTLEHPLFFYYRNVYTLPSSITETLGTNLVIDTLTNSDSLQRGSIVFSWTAPADSDKTVLFYVKDQNVVREIFDGIITGATVNHLNKWQVYDFSLLNPATYITSEKYKLFNFSIANIDVNSKSKTYLSKIEVQYFSNIWRVLGYDELLNINHRVQRIKYFVDDEEFRAAKLTFLKNGIELVYDL